jgi:uncharacterized protein YjbI with pentapeptide repeats
MQQILNASSGSVIYQADVATMKECVASALAAKVDLIEADLSEMDLSGLDFHQANCTWAYFSGSDLGFASFVQCNLYGAKFPEADLTDADLTRANLFEVELTQSQVDSLSSELSAHQLGQVTITE